MKSLFRSQPQRGTVEWIGVRPGREEPVIVKQSVELSVTAGVAGDRFAGGRTNQRQVTLIQAEHLAVVGKILGTEIDPSQTRRNLVVAGINLQSLKQTQFRVGTAVLEGTANCPPCSKMERNLGAGGYNAMRGHGGICARVIVGGVVEIGDSVEFQRLCSDSADRDGT